MHFSKASTYGIRSVAFMAARRGREMISIRELSRELGIPPAFLTKVMQRLASRNIVKTMRGFGGGVALGRPPREITLKEIITAVEGEEAFQPVGLGIPKEQMERTPDFFKKWNNLNDSIDHFFSLTKLSELCPNEIAGQSDTAESEAGPAVSQADEAVKPADTAESEAGQAVSQANATESEIGQAKSQAHAPVKPDGSNTTERKYPSLHL